MPSVQGDDLFDDRTDERPEPATLNDPAPAEPWTKIWDDVHIQKTTAYCEKAHAHRPVLFCFWCRSILKGGHNISKAEAHLAKKKGNDIRPCPALIPSDYARLYSQIYKAKQASKAATTTRRARKRRAEQELIDNHNLAVV